MSDKLYKIWLVEIYSDEGAAYEYPIACTYKPEQWFADIFKSKEDDDASIIEFTTNLNNTDRRHWHYCTVTQGDYNYNECKALSISDVGFDGTTIISKFKPVLLSKWNDEEQCYLPFIEPVFTFFEEVNYSKPKLSVFKVELDNLVEAIVK